MPKKPPEPLTPEEMDSLVTAASGNDFYFMLFNVAKTTGRRIGELYGVEKKECIGEKESSRRKKDGTPVMLKVYKYTGDYHFGVQVKDIIFEEDGTATMKVWVLKRRNYVQDETILTKGVATIVRKYINRHKLKLEDYLFRKKSYRQIQSAVKSFAKKGYVKKNVMFHSFRHYFITHYLKKGWSYNQVAKLTGHKSINSLGSYDHVVSRDLRDKALEDMEGI